MFHPRDNAETLKASALIKIAMISNCTVRIGVSLLGMCRGA
jgi:hypothetical protein